MKILVTGANGQVGFELTRLADRSCAIPGACDTASIRSAEAGSLTIIACNRADLDITDEAAVREAIAATRPRLVINAAAYTAVDRAETEPSLAHACNATGPANLARSCREAGIPLFHLSTDYVFDGMRQTPYFEDDAVSPLGVYGTSKLAGEEAVRALIAEHIILRTSWVFGSHGGNFVKTMLRLGQTRPTAREGLVPGEPGRAEARPELKIVDDQRGGPTAAQDIATTLLTLAKRFGEGQTMAWGTYHFCGKPAVTWRVFAEEIFRQAAALTPMTIPVITPISTAEYPTPARRPTHSELDCQRLFATFAIAQPDWRQSLAAVLRELLANQLKLRNV